MPDYIYLLENRLSPSQREAVRKVRDAARDEAMTVFLTGGAVRDLTTGSPVRDLDFSVQGNALKLKTALTQAGGTFWGEHAPTQTLFFSFPGNVRVEVASTRREEYPKPGKPEYHWDTILEDLRRRDFTANAMALSLNDMSFGLLMDPLNGVADIEQRILRLVSNYGFLESPVRMLRAARLIHRLQWVMDEKTETRLQNAKDEGMMQQLTAYDKGYELQEIGHEENPLAVLKSLEEMGWMKELFPAWTSSKADVSGLEQMHEVHTRLQMQGVNPDPSTAAFELLTARMQSKDLEALKKTFVRQGFVKEWARLAKDAEDFSKQLTAKEANAPSATWKLFQTANPSAVLWLGLTGKGAATQNKYKNFFSVWPEFKSQLPAVMMQEMRITPEIPRYAELVEKYFYDLIDGKLKTEEEIRAFLEPYSPPAPPPPVNLRRARATKKAESKKESKKVSAAAAKENDVEGGDEDDAPAKAPKGPKVKAEPKGKAEKPAAPATAASLAPAVPAKAVAAPVAKAPSPVASKSAPPAKHAHKVDTSKSAAKAPVKAVAVKGKPVAVKGKSVGAPSKSAKKPVAVKKAMKPQPKKAKPAAKAPMKKSAPAKKKPLAKKPAAKAARKKR